MQDALAAARGETAFHYRGVWQSQGVSQVVEGDASSSSGSESVVVGDDRFTVTFLGGVAYFRGDATAVRDELGLTGSDAPTAAGRWIALQQSGGLFPWVEDGLTTSAALAQVLIAPATVSPSHRIRGVVVTSVSGRIPHGRVVTGSARLLVMVRSKLPVSYSARGTDGGKPWSSSIVFSRWGEHAAVVAPADALPFSALLARVVPTSRADLTRDP